MPVPKKSEAELEAMSLDELRQLAMQEAEELAAEAQAAAEKEAAAVETPEQIAEREAAEAAQKEADEKAAAEKEAAEKEAAEKAAAERTEQERDEQGRFKKIEEQVPPEEDEGEPEEYIYRREIDLGDGSGVEVFEGRGETELEAMQELNDKVIEAKRNANKTIHEFQRKHPKVEEPPKETPISEDLEYVFKQQFEKKPSEAFKAMFKELTGMDIAEFKTRQAAQDAAEKARAAQQQSLAVQREFVEDHPEYVVSLENGNALRDWVQEHNYSDFTRDNLEKAFEDLSGRGLLTLKTDEASAPTRTEVKSEVKPTVRIEQPVTPTVTEVAPVRSPKKASSVSSKGSPAPVIKTGPTEDELYSMPMDQLKELSNRQLAELNRQ